MQRALVYYKKQQQQPNNRDDESKLRCKRSVIVNGTAVTLAARQWVRRLAGSVLVVLSFSSIVLSLGAPGLGWALSGATLIAASLCSPLIGRGWLVACSALTVVLLLTFGPVGYYDSSTFDPDWVMAAFTFGPLAIGLVALLAPYWTNKPGRMGR